MANSNNTDPFFNSNSYISFDATSLRDLIVSRLNEGQVFTDQNYTGSNISSFLDVISFAYSTLLYYLNKTATESLFSESQIYENMNRIVKLLNYKPIGKVAQSVNYYINVTTRLPAGTYMIPRYSYIRVGGVNFSFNKDIYFTYDAVGILKLQNPESDFYLYQGTFNEYPIYNAIGNDSEIVYLSLANTYIDHFNVHVYVKSKATGIWEQWTQSENLFLNNAKDKVFELRYNPNKNYEIKFGDDINGKKLQAGDEILLYYLNIDPTASTIAANAFKTSTVIYYNSLNYTNIQKNIIGNDTVLIPTQFQLTEISLINDYPSNPYSEEESVNDIRKNVPKSFTYQQRLVTSDDFVSYILGNYKYMLSDVKVVNNEQYLNSHMKYLYDIGINSPQLDNRILYSQVKFSNSCNFNNVYVYMVPSNTVQKYVTPAQKELLLNDINEKKVLTCDVVPIDPVYVYFDFYLKSPSTPSVNDLNQSKLLIYKTSNTRRASSAIINDVINVIKNYFNKQTSTLGQLINLSQMTTDMLNVDGVDNIKTYRADTDTYLNGLSFLVWNESYPSADINICTQNLQLEFFKYPIFNNIDNLASRINVIEPSGIIQVTDF
jgi:hypothetical protein